MTPSQPGEGKDLIRNEAGLWASEAVHEVDVVGGIWYFNKFPNVPHQVQIDVATSTMTILGLEEENPPEGRVVLTLDTGARSRITHRGASPVR